MIARIIKHEWRLLVTDKLLWTVLPVYALLIGYGVYNGAAWVNFQEATIASAQSQSDETIQGLKDTTKSIEAGGPVPVAFEDPRDAGLVSRGLGFEFATLPPTSMAPLAIGQSDLLPYYIRVTRRSLDELVTTDEIENPINLAAGRFDLGFVFTFLFPLLILALTYNLLSSEREQGTQAILLSQPVSVRSWVTGKIILRGMVVFGAALVLSIAAFLLSGVPLFSADALARLAIWIVVLAGYGAFWFALAILVNAFGLKSSTNALVLMGAWLCFVLLLPSLLNVLAKTAYPTPSRIDLVQALRSAEAKIDSDANTVTASRETEAAAPAYGTDENQNVKLALTDYYRDLLTTEQRSETLRAQITAGFDRQIESQQTFVQRFRYVSPAIMTQAAITELAGTDAARYQRFDDAVKTFHQSWRAFFDPKIMRDNRVTAAEYAQLPRFKFVEEPLSRTVGRSMGNIAPLLLFAAIAMLIGFQRLKSYRVVG